MRAQLASIGVGPGKTFNFKDLSLEHKAGGRARYERRRRRRSREAVSKVGKTINGWQVSGRPGDSAHYNGDWLVRAARRRPGSTATIRRKRCTRSPATTSTARRSTAARTQLHPTFPAGQQPPVNAFWSVTMYDGKTQLLIENPIDRYLINSPMLPDMKKNPDGR